MSIEPLLGALERAAMQPIEDMDDNELLDALDTVRDLEQRISDRWYTLYRHRP
jgi:hypothetical protein